MCVLFFMLSVFRFVVVYLKICICVSNYVLYFVGWDEEVNVMVVIVFIFKV